MHVGQNAHQLGLVPKDHVESYEQITKYLFDCMKKLMMVNLFVGLLG